MKQIYYYDSPIGTLAITASKDFIHGVGFANEIQANPNNVYEIILTCKKQLDEYFTCKRTQFDLPLQFISGTKFQQDVWKALANIPYGKTVCYKDIATQIGNEKAVRAVGGANNKNPLLIIIPCHRVIGKNGKLVGFGGGIDKKEWLLKHENKEEQ